MSNEAAKAYLNDVAKELSSLPGYKKDLLQKLREEIENYLEEHPEADREALIAEFGSAEEISELWLGSAPAQTVKRGLSQKKKILLAVLAGIVVIAIILTVYILLAVLAGIVVIAIILTVYLVDRHIQREKILDGYWIETIQVDSIDESEITVPPVVSSYDF